MTSRMFKVVLCYKVHLVSLKLVINLCFFLIRLWMVFKVKFDLQIQQLRRKVKEIAAGLQLTGSTPQTKVKIKLTRLIPK